MKPSRYNQVAGQSQLSSYDNLDRLQVEKDQSTMVSLLQNGNEASSGREDNKVGQSPNQLRGQATVPVSSTVRGLAKPVDYSENSEQERSRGLKFYWKNWVHKSIGHGQSAAEIESTRRADILSKLSELKDTYGFLPKVNSQKDLRILKNPKATIIRKTTFQKLAVLGSRLLI